MLAKSAAQFFEGSGGGPQDLNSVLPFCFQFFCQGLGCFLRPFFIFIFEDDARQKSVRWIVQHLAHRIFMFEQFFEVLSNGTGDGIVFRLTGLQGNPAGGITSARSSGDLTEQLSRFFRRPEIGKSKGHVSIEDSH